MKTVHDLRLEMPRGQLVMALASEIKSLALEVKPLVLILLTIVPL